MCPLVSPSARATSVAVMWAHALRAAAGGIFLLSTTTHLCIVWPRCGSVTALPSDERQAGRYGREIPQAQAPHNEASVAAAGLPLNVGELGCGSDRSGSGGRWQGVTRVGFGSGTVLASGY